MASIIEKIKGGIIVSCQAHEEDGLYGPENMALMAKAAELGGAVGIRADDPKHIAAIRKTVKLPIIGIYKEDVDGYETRITLNMDRAREIFEAGSDIIALDVTNRPHPYNTTGIEMIKQIKEQFGCLVMADISTFEEGVAAAEAGADKKKLAEIRATLESGTLGPDEWEDLFSFYSDFYKDVFGHRPRDVVRPF